MLKEGVVLGKRYEVMKRIGAGGMADVYKGKDHMLNRYIAIKVLKTEFREDENFVRKFRSEAQAAAGLMNPNIVNVYDVGEDRGLYYMIMELVDGITLKGYIDRKQRLSSKEVISIAIQICNGIDAAHKHHIIHRDIKPQNIIISKDGKVKVTDFGIARAVTSNTVSTNAMGSVYYTSPEQAKGGFSDAKSDIYSLGITLFEMVTGDVPFDGETTVEVAVKHLQEEIRRPSSIVQDVPYSLEQIILKCTQKNTERRYSNITELVRDLKHSLVDPEGDFVKMIPLRNADTVIISEEELDDIRHSYEDDESEEYEDEEYEDDDYEDDDYDDYDRVPANKKRGDSDVNPRMAKVMKILTIVVAVIIVFMLVFVIGKAAGLFKSFGPGTTQESADNVKVPNVVGKTQEEAIQILEEAGLGYKIAASRESETYAMGVVMEQKTAANKRVAKETKIELVISAKLIGQEIVIPNVVGMDEGDAQKTLEDAGFTKIKAESVYNQERAQGEVVATTPSANTKATKDTQIVMQVSKGAEKKTVPNVIGMSLTDARAAIEGAGLVVGTVSEEYSDGYAEGIVMSQTGESGKKVDAGTNIGMAVSKGKKPEEKRTVPNIIGVDESTARQMILDAGLTPRIVEYTPDSTVAKGAVIKCEPGVGESLTPGTTVSLYISEGPPATPDPDPAPEGGQ